VVRSTLKLLMAVLAPVGFTGMHLSLVRRNGVLGLVGFLVLSAGYRVIMGTAFVLPTVAVSDAAHVDDVVAAVTGGSPAGDIGALAIVIRSRTSAPWLAACSSASRCSAPAASRRWATVLVAIGGVVAAGLSA
jgi:hypothetical protein